MVAALVLWQRGAFAGDGPPARTLSGSTAQGANISFVMRGERIVAFTVDSIGGRCRGGAPWSIQWDPSTTQANVTYRRHGEAFLVHEHPDPRFPHPAGTRVDAYMLGRVREGGRRVDGTLGYLASATRNVCASGAVHFAAGKP